MANPLISGNSRVFIAPDLADPTKPYEYHSCMKVSSSERSFGERNPIRVPMNSPRPKMIGHEKEDAEGWSVALSGLLPHDYKSILRRIADKESATFDFQVHIGQTTNPADFNAFDKAIVYENAYLLNYSLGSVGALSGAESQLVPEEVSISSLYSHEIIKPKLIKVSGISGSGVIADMDSVLVEESRGNWVTHYYGVITPISSATDVISIIYSLDNGETWTEKDVVCNGLTSAPQGHYSIACSQNKVFLVCNNQAGKGHVYAFKMEEVWDSSPLSLLNCAEEVTIPCAHRYMDTNTTNLRGAEYIPGYLVCTNFAGTHIFFIDENSLYPTKVEISIDQDCYATHAYSPNLILVAGDFGQISAYRGGAGTQTIQLDDGTTPITSEIYSIFALTENTWFAGTGNGKLCVTQDSGKTWKLISTFSGRISSVRFATRNIGYVALRSNVYFPYLYMTIDGGASWFRIDNSSNALTSKTVPFGIALDKQDPSKFVLYGKQVSSITADSLNVDLAPSSTDTKFLAVNGAA